MRKFTELFASLKAQINLFLPHFSHFESKKESKSFFLGVFQRTIDDTVTGQMYDKLLNKLGPDAKLPRWGGIRNYSRKKFPVWALSVCAILRPHCHTELGKCENLRLARARRCHTFQFSRFSPSLYQH